MTPHRLDPFARRYDQGEPSEADSPFVCTVKLISEASQRLLIVIIHREYFLGRRRVFSDN